jgi:hypothetical protein
MPPDEFRSEGTPSLSEGPYVRGETFGYFGAFAKVTRCKSGTLSGRYRSNGYVLDQEQFEQLVPSDDVESVHQSKNPSHSTPNKKGPVR